MAYLGTKPANQIIDSTLIADGVITTADLANGAVTDAKMAAMAATKLTGQVPRANATSGSVIQVVSVTKTDTFSTTSGSAVDITGLSVAITPTSSSNRILITGSICWGSSDSVPYLAGMRLVRDSTPICIADTAGSRGRFTIGAQGIYSTDHTLFAPLNFVDSPATTSSTTYKLQGQAESGRTLWINRGGESDGDVSITGRFISTITVMEIAA
jgi:hypothetical protein